ncbi:DNA-methyltransferase [Aliarcobacter butzleri]|uniref:DNA-methyltransferase n=1 Tax=Aliarcobacter butzleri TaxID=28197 RepID=UPI002B24353D|nr:site-specific DNA-methyltransferase [Aliarcobacter butzleri]
MSANVINRVFNCDCSEFMKEMPNKCVDLILTDPPYLLTKSDPGTTGYLSMSLDKYKENGRLRELCDGFDIEETLCEFERILKKVNIFIFCSNKQISSIMSWGEKRGYFTTLLIWHKYNSAPFANGVWRQDAEFCVHIREKGSYFLGDADLKQKVTRLPCNPSKFGHPTEKPLKLVEKYLKIGASKGHIVFDPYLGSGTTAVACKSLGINYIGCEIKKDYFKIINKRLSQVQGILF